MQTCKILSIDRTLAAVLASIILLLVSLSLPFLSLSKAGVNSTISVLDAVASLWMSDMLWLGPDDTCLDCAVAAEQAGVVGVGTGSYPLSTQDTS